jgi:hypothetical protein
MRTFAQKPKATQQTTSAKSTIPSQAHLGQSREVRSILHLQRPIGNQAVQQLLQAKTEDFKASPASGTSTGLTWDFSRISVHASPRGNMQPNLKVNTPCDILGKALRVHELARHGLSGSAQPMPRLEAIQLSFGRHALTGVRAFIGAPAREANERMGSSAFTSGDSVAFKQSPDLHTAAHEAAHIVQQRAGVQLPGGVGKSGDRHEQHADAVADAVVRGESAESLLDRYGTTRWSGSVQVQHRNGSGSTTTAEEEVCEALRSAFDNSRRVIALYREFLAGNVNWDEMRDQTRTIGNAAQGVTGAGHDLPQVVQDAIEEVESFGLEEIQQGGALLWESIVGDDESFHTQWVRNEIERQQHFNLVLIRMMYENGCPDFPGTWRDFQEQVLSIGTRGREVTQQPGTTTTGRTAETRTAVAWVEIGGEEVLVLATEVGGSGRLRFVRWIDSDFRDLALQQARDRQGSIPSVPSSAVIGLPSSVPSSASRR